MKNDTPIDLKKLEIHPNNAFEFIKNVMRFEFALKATGFVESRGSRLLVQWHDFAGNQLPSEFFNLVDDANIAKTLIASPPQKQYLEREGQLSFKDVPSPTNNQQLFDAITRLRNNLFHGGKSGDLNQERNELLISEAIAVLQKSLAYTEDVRREFEGLY
jgi:hypothetical protein